MEFAHLHTHTDGSLLDGMSPVHKTVAQARKLGMTELAITDHGSLCNHQSFVSACLASGVKPILGVEAYVHFDGQVGHLTLLADGDEGYRNLVSLNNMGHASSYDRPAFDIDALVAHSKDLVVLSGCRASPFQMLPEAEAVRLAAKLKPVFGGRLFSEVMFVDDYDVMDRAMVLYAKAGIKPVLTNDVHFPSEDQAELHPHLCQMKSGGSFSYDSKELWMKPPETIAERALELADEALLRDMIGRASLIAKKLRTPNIRRPESLPHIESADSILKDKVILRLAGRPKPYWDRVAYELDVIRTMGYAAYFLILEDIVSHAREIGCRLGPGRGSGAGSLVLYLLGITQVDPLVFGLSFDRFLNVERIGMPDVDTDLDSSMRDQVIEYAAHRWGGIPIATYARYTHKTLVTDLGKEFSLPQDLTVTAADKGPMSPEFAQLCDLQPLVMTAYEAMLGQIRHRGQHPGGVVIPPAGVPVPVERAGSVKDRRLVAAWTEGLSGRDLTLAGLVKFDFLGLTAVEAVKLMAQMSGAEAPLPDLEKDDAVYDLFRKGDLTGIFQFSGSPGITDLTVRVAPKKFQDLADINALYRPGPMDSGMTEQYVDLRTNPRRFRNELAAAMSEKGETPSCEAIKLLSDLDRILEPTAGIIVYQEQMMSVYQLFVGGTYGAADAARSTITKGGAPGGRTPAWVEKMAKLKSNFVKGGTARGLPEDFCAHLFHELETHARYSFNKAHAVAYSVLAYQMAWYKTFYSAAFYTAMMNVDNDNSASYLFDAVRHGIEVVPPHVNYSDARYVWDRKTNRIYVPLSQVRFLGDAGVAHIIAERKKRPFDSFRDLRGRLPQKQVNARAVKGLLSVGALSGLSGDVKKDLKLKDFDLTSLWGDADHEVQYEFLGTVIPTKEMVKMLDGLKSRGYVAGLVTGHKKKKSKKGGKDYIVYALAPAGSFWCYDEIPSGTMVKARKNDYGKALSVERIAA